MTEQTKWLSPDAIFDGQQIVTGMSLRIDGTKVTQIAPAPKGQKPRHMSGLACHGFVDLQVNGGGNHLFNATPTPNTIREIARAHRRFGTTQIMPTVITDDAIVLNQAVDAILTCHKDAGILGLHIEGPHISADRRGTHALKHIRPMDKTTLGLVARLRDADVPVMITVAPEATTHAQVAALSEMGAIVSIGHTDATAHEARDVMKAGATCVTHLFNAMSPMLNRAPGVVGAAINSDAYCGIICDGLHVADEMVGLAIRARPTKGRTFLVSDAMPTVGGQDHFDLYGARIRLENGKLINAEGSLAGAHVTMFQSVARLVNQIGIPLADALAMATTVPFAAMFGNNAPANPLIGADLSDVLLLDDGLTGFTFADAHIQPADA